MSNNLDSERPLEVSGADEVGDQRPSLFDLNQDLTGSSDDSNGFVHVESSAGTAENALDDEVSYQDDKVLGGEENPLQGNSAEAKVTEDSGKEDMFMDCPDELVSNSDGKEAVPSVEVEKENSEGALESYAADDQGSVAGEYQGERESFAKQIADLRKQLKVFADQQSLLDQSDGYGLVDIVNLAESQDADTSMNGLISECAKIVKSASKERLQTVAAVQELNAALLIKDQEIEHLSAKVAELSVSNDVVTSYLDAAQKSTEVASEAQEKNSQIDMVLNRVLASLAGVLDQHDLEDESIGGKLVSIERNTSLIIEKYNWILYEVEKLKQCLSEASLDVGLQGDFGTIFSVACGELLELKRKDLYFVEKMNHLEDENRQLVEQHDNQRMRIELINHELGKTKAELEQEKNRCANTKEKLTIAVTKGKALVQQRDSLKQSLVEKTTEIEKCLAQLQEKSSALAVAELNKQELVSSESMVVSLQDALSKSNFSLEKLEEFLSEIVLPEQLVPMDIVEKYRWLIDESSRLRSVSLEFQKVIDALSPIDLPEPVSFSDLESRVHWLRESYSRAKSELIMLQDEMLTIRDSAQKEIDCLTASLSLELQAKDYIQMELNDLRCKYKEEVDKAHEISLEKDQFVRKLLEVSGTVIDDEGFYQPSSDTATLIDNCVQKVKELSVASLSSYFDAESFEIVQRHLYVRDLELMLCKLVIEDDMLVKADVNNLSNELRVLSQELVALKEEKASLQNDLERSEDKSSLLREKLSMAVKKGKGLVQDRENLRQLVEEKDSEIGKMRVELNQLESELASCKDRIASLSADVEHVPKLEADLVAIKGERDQFEQFLLQSNKLLQRLSESIDGIVVPIDAGFQEPLEKVNWLVGYVKDCQEAKEQAEKELLGVKEETTTLVSNLTEAQATRKSLEDALSVAEENFSRLAEEKRELEAGKDNVEWELQTAVEQISLHTNNFEEVCASKKSLEEAFSQAENNLSVLVSEKESALASRAIAETELEKAKGEIAILNHKLTEAYKNIKSLEDALSQAETNIVLVNEKESALVSREIAETELEKTKEEIAVLNYKLLDADKTIKSLENSLSQAETNIASLSEQNNDAQVSSTNLENELRKLQEEAGSQATNLADAVVTIKSLENSLLKAENSISVLEVEKKNAKEEILRLHSKLNACIEELDGTKGILKNRSIELDNYLNDIQVLLNDDTLLLRIKQCFVKKFENLKEIDTILGSITDHFVGMGLDELQRPSVMEKDGSQVTNILSDSLDNFAIFEKDSADGENTFPSFQKVTEGFQLRNKILAERVEDIFSSVDDLVAALLRKLQATRDGIIAISEDSESLKQKISSLEMYKQELEATVALLEKDVRTLLLACTDATKELQFEVKNNFLELSSLPQFGELADNLSYGIGGIGVDFIDSQSLDHSKLIKAAEVLLDSARKVKAFVKHSESTTRMTASIIVELQNNLKEAKMNLEKIIEDRDLKQNRVSQLEANMEALQNSCSEQGRMLQELQDKEHKLIEREEEVSSLYNALVKKEQEDALLTASQAKAIFDKIRVIEIPMLDSENEDLEPHNSTDVKKLFYMIDYFTYLQHHIKLLSDENEELKSTLSTQTLELQHSKEEIGKYLRDKQGLEKMNNELSDISFSLEKIINIFGGDSLVGDQKSSGMKGLLSVLEKRVMGLYLESESSKTKTMELDEKLVGSQKIVDELSTKVKLLEGSLRGRDAQADMLQERSIFEAPSSLPTGTEISEIEDAGPLIKNKISPVPSAAHVRTLRKGSSDHLALDIDLESNRLINSEETDEDKGHVFKSLNTSGLVPKQGKLIADRIDGIWVSGGRVLMSHPRARLGLIAYWLFVHMWLLGTIL